jgi:hypothetical protein
MNQSEIVFPFSFSFFSSSLHIVATRYKSINPDSNAFKTKLAILIGPMALLKAAGFDKDESDGKLKYNG